MGQVLVETQPAEGSARFLAPIVRGIDPDLEAKVSVLPSSVKSGEFDLRGNGLLLGRSLAGRLDVMVGDRLLVHSVRDLQQMRETSRAGREEVQIPPDYDVRGIYDVGYYEYNDLFVVCSLANAQDLYGLGDAVHGLTVMLQDPDRAGVVGRELEDRLGGDFTLGTWKEENAVILEALVVEKNVMFYLLFFIMVVAAFGITSALITFVVQKTREIGMLKALGATNPQVMGLFLFQSLVVGVFGVLAGIGLGLLAVSYRNEFLAFMRQVTGFQLFPESIYNFTGLPALVVPADVVVICGGSLLICLLAGLIPAWNAGRLRPVEALRYE
jgi:lipoprotein-releasing system permease protein